MTLQFFVQKPPGGEPKNLVQVRCPVIAEVPELGLRPRHLFTARAEESIASSSTSRHRNGMCGYCASGTVRAMPTAEDVEFRT